MTEHEPEAPPFVAARRKQQYNGVVAPLSRSNSVPVKEETLVERQERRAGTEPVQRQKGRAGTKRPQTLSNQERSRSTSSACLKVPTASTPLGKTPEGDFEPPAPVPSELAGPSSEASSPGASPPSSAREMSLALPHSPRLLASPTRSSITGASPRRSFSSQSTLKSEDRKESLFSEFLTVDAEAQEDKKGPLRRSVSKVIDSLTVKVLVGLATLASLVAVVKDTDLRASGEPVPDWLAPLELVIYFIFLVEVILRVFVERLEVFKSVCSLADIVVVISGTIEYLLVLRGVKTDLAKMQALRLVRLMKLVRVVYKVPLFFELRKLVAMMGSCIKTLFWSFMVLALVMTAWSIVAVELVHPLVIQLSDAGEWPDCERCRRSFSSVFHSNITFFQTIVAGDSWGMMAIPVIEVHPWTAFIFVGALLTLVFGVLNVIVAVVVDAFAEARAKDVFTRAREMAFEEKQEKKTLATIFKQIDADGNGTLDLDELKAGAKKVEMFSHWLRVLDIDGRDLEEMFNMLDGDGSGDIDTDEFVECMYRMKNVEAKTATQFVKQRITQMIVIQSNEMGCIKNSLDEVSDLVTSSIRNSDDLKSQIEKDILGVQEQLRVSLKDSLVELSPDKLLGPAVAALEEMKDTVTAWHTAREAAEKKMRGIASKETAAGGSSYEVFLERAGQLADDPQLDGGDAAAQHCNQGYQSDGAHEAPEAALARYPPEALMPQTTAAAPLLLARQKVATPRCHRSLSAPTFEAMALRGNGGPILLHCEVPTFEAMATRANGGPILLHCEVPFDGAHGS